MESDLGIWDELHRNVRKAERAHFEANERDEGELERTGQPLCIYEIYNGVGAWPFLHHGSMYRGLSLVSFICPKTINLQEIPIYRLCFYSIPVLLWRFIAPTTAFWYLP